MSSHTKKLTETIRMIDGLKRTLESTAIESEYQRGLYNGFELMRSMLSNLEPKILDKAIKEPRVFSHTTNAIRKRNNNLKIKEARELLNKPTGDRANDEFYKSLYKEAVSEADEYEEPEETYEELTTRLATEYDG